MLLVRYGLHKSAHLRPILQHENEQIKSALNCGYIFDYIFSLEDDK